MVPLEIRSIFQTLRNLGITDTDGARQTTVTVRFNEIMHLLKGSLVSPTPLTDLILHKTKISSTNITVKFEPGMLLNQITKEATSSNNEESMILKVMIQKSTNKLLFAQAEEDFIDFLFSFLTIPLGSVEYLLGSDTCFTNINNLYRSIDNVDKYLISRTKQSLLKPELAPMCLSKKQFLSLKERTNPQIYWYENDSKCGYVFDYIYRGMQVLLKDPRGSGKSFIKGPGIYTVSDDLTVTPLCLSSTLSVLQFNKIPFSDVEEVEIKIGKEEGLSILKASLTSTCALTNGLSHILMKQPKLEK